MLGTTLYFYTLFDTAEPNLLVDKYKEFYKGETPDLWTGNSFSAAIAMVEALKKADSMECSAVISALEGLSFNGTSGPMTIRKADHVTLQKLAVVKLQDSGKGYPEPILLELIDADKCAPPITAPGRG